jgi:glycosyltransferase involved in cell wall biosynthesis
MRNAEPEVSVLLPCYNAAAFLPACLASLFEQSFDRFEIVAVDDGSQDRTSRLLEESARRDRRLKVIRRDHRGVATALRIASEEARAPIVARMDADDICRPDRLAVQVDFLRGHSEVGVVGSCVRFFPREGLTDGLLRYESWVNGLVSHEQMVSDLFVESPLPHPSVMMRRECLDRVGGYREMGWPEDYDLWMRMAGAGVRFAKTPQELLWWRDRPERASRVDPRFDYESFVRLKEHFLLETFLADRRAAAVWGAGPIGKSWARRLAKKGIEITHFVEIDPRKIGKHIHGAAVISPAGLDRIRGTPLLVAVGALSRRADGCFVSAREEIRPQLAAAGWVDGRDFVCVA